MTRQAQTITESFIESTATLGPAGYADRAPGTWGSVFAAAAAPWLFLPFGLTGRITLLLIVLAVGTAVSGWMIRRTGRKDPKEVVVDELLGQWTAMLLVPQGALAQAVASLLLFRLFDILKPGLVGKAEKLPGGMGVMADDLVAGALAAMVMYLLFSQTPGI